jgi:hypothetical protein
LDENIKKYYDSLSEEERSLFWTINIDETTSLDYIVDYMKNA